MGRTSRCLFRGCGLRSRRCLVVPLQTLENLSVEGGGWVIDDAIRAAGPVDDEKASLFPPALQRSTKIVGRPPVPRDLCDAGSSQLAIRRLRAQKRPFFLGQLAVAYQAGVRGHLNVEFRLVRRLGMDDVCAAPLAGLDRHRASRWGDLGDKEPIAMRLVDDVDGFLLGSRSLWSSRGACRALAQITTA